MIKSLIPGTDGFKASTCGRVFDDEDVERNYYVNGDGYVTASVRSAGVWTTFGVQRLVLLAFKGDERTAERDQVNHIDGDIKNNDLDNLEWVSVKENNIHASILSGNPEKPILVVVSPDFEYALIDSKEKACELIGCTFKELWVAVKEGLMVDGWSVRHNSGPLPVQLTKDTTSGLRTKVGVKLLDVDTKEIKVFPSMFEAAAFLGTTPSLVHQTLTRDGKVRLCMRKYIAVLDGSVFPDIDEETLERLRQHKSRPVITAKIGSSEVVLYQTAVDFYRKNGLSKKAVTTSLRSDRLREVGGFIFLYMNPANAM